MVTNEDTLSSQVFLHLHLSVSSWSLYAHFLDCGWMLHFFQADKHNAPLITANYLFLQDGLYLITLLK